MDTLKDKLNKDIVALLQKHYPQTKDLAHYLIDTLDLSKESAYRRIRNEVFFTFEEIAILSLKLEISIDKLIGSNASKAYLDMPLCYAEKPEDIYKEILLGNIKALKKLHEAQDSMQYSILNRLPYGLITYSEAISKFYYYKWYLHIQKEVDKIPFSEFIVPQSLMECFDEFALVSGKTPGKMDLILDPNCFVYTVNEIDYYRKRGLLNENDIKTLKEQLLSIVDQIADVARNGTNVSQAEIKIYLSGIDIEPSYSYVEYDGNMAFFIWSPAGDIVTSTNPEFCARQKEWIESLIRHTTLITQCNEIQQLRFFDSQRKYISEMK